MSRRLISSSNNSKRGRKKATGSRYEHTFLRSMFLVIVLFGIVSTVVQLMHDNLTRDNNNNNNNNNIITITSSVTTEFRTGIPKILPLPQIQSKSPQSPLGVHMVVSHCTESIGWIWRNSDCWKRLHGNNKNYAIKSVTIITKCGKPIPPEDLPPVPQPQPSNEQDPCGTPSSVQLSTPQPLVSIVSLPNVGRCDHSYAYWISTILVPEPRSRDQDHQVLYSNYANTTCHIDGQHQNKSSNNNNNNEDPFHRIRVTIQKADIVLFLKDNDNTYRKAWKADSAQQQHRPSIPELLTLVSENETKPPMNSDSSVTTLTGNNNTTTQQVFQIPSFPSGLACREPAMKSFRKFEVTEWSHRSILWTFQLNSYHPKHHRIQYNNVTHIHQQDNNKPQQQNTTPGFWSHHRPMGAWIQSLMTRSRNKTADKGLLLFSDEYLEQAVQPFHPGHKLPTLTQQYRQADLVPVCVGGVFATHWGQLSSLDAPVTPRGWQTIARALSRGDSIEEGHYMERWWGDLFSWSSYARTTQTTTTSPRKGNSVSVGASSCSEHNSNGHNNHFKCHRTMTVASDTAQALLFSLKLKHMIRIIPGLILLDNTRVKQEMETISQIFTSLLTTEDHQSQNRLM